MCLRGASPKPFWGGIPRQTAPPFARKLVNAAWSRWLRGVFTLKIVPCPADATTSSDGSTFRDDCLCNRDFFMNEKQLCERCPLPGSNCTEPGSTLETLWLEPGYCACAPAREIHPPLTGP